MWLKSGTLALIMVFSLIAVALYMAFAFPYTLMSLKQSETTEIKSVIIVARNGEKSPNPDAYFVGEELPRELQQVGYNQLTNTGKERMYLLGKYLKMKYYSLLLNGNPRKLFVRSADNDRCLESAQALLAGINPPQAPWIWSSEFDRWQPKAVHSADARDDDLLSSDSACLRSDRSRIKWKSSTKYYHLINEFKHDFETLRQNTELDFENDLEMLTHVEDLLKTRVTFKESDVPSWYTTTFANRLSHIADVSTGSRFREPDTQRLYVGRLLHEINENVNSQIRLDKEKQISLREADKTVQEQQPLRPTNIKVDVDNEPRMFIYMTDKMHLSALMNSLKVYSSQPMFGATLLIELHYDPVNQVYFLRLYTLSSSSPNVFPEPVRVNPIACVNSAECDPQEFEQNIRHLMMDKVSWQAMCVDQLMTKPVSPPTLDPMPLVVTEVPVTNLPTTQAPDMITILSTTEPSTSTSSQSITTTLTPLGDDIEKLDQSLIVGPLDNGRPLLPSDESVQNGHLEQIDEATTAPMTTTVEPTITTTTDTETSTIIALTTTSFAVVDEQTPESPATPEIVTELVESSTFSALVPEDDKDYTTRETTNAPQTEATTSTDTTTFAPIDLGSPDTTTAANQSIGLSDKEVIENQSD